MGDKSLNKYRCIPFWSWNDELDENELVKQVDWMHDHGVGGFFMHARGGLTTPYLGEKWFSCIDACLKRAKELDMEAYAYDENGWPSGFCGGKLLNEEENCDTYLTKTYGEYDPKSMVSYDLSGDKLVKTTSGNNCLNIFLNVSKSTVDICDKRVVKKFIESTHEEYKKRDKYGNLRGFFTDEPQYYRWGNPWTKVMPQYFKEHYNEDVYERLGLLFVKKEGYRDFRYKYWKAMQDLMLNSFAKQIYDWCDKNNYKLTGHYVEENSLGYQIVCSGGIMPFYEYEHIPGCDWLGRNIGANNANPKQLGSVAAQLGKKQVLCEMFACIGWDTTPLELKHIAEFLMVDGVNLMCQHLLPYKEHGQRKRDYPEHYSAINPWTDKGFNVFNDYFAKLGELLSNSTEIVNIGLLQPIRSCYFEYQREDENNAFGVSENEIAYDYALNTLSKKQLPFHLLDETIMAKHARVEGNKLIVGNCAYTYVLLPDKTFTMDKTTEVLLKEFVKNGGKIYLFGDKPTYLEGQPYEYDYLLSNCTLDEMVENQDFKGQENINFRVSYRLDKQGQPYLYVVNLGEETTTTYSAKNYTSFKCDDKVYGNTIHFNKYESKILYFSNEPIKEEKTLQNLELKDTFKITKPVDNYLTLDTLKYSTDGVNYSSKLHHMCIFDLLLNKRYQGELYLKYELDIESLPSNCFALIEDCHNLEVKVNGKIVRKTGTILEKDLWKYNIQDALIKGHNEIVVKINFLQNESVYYALFGGHKEESLKNCLSYPTTIEAIYLVGDFGIIGDFIKGQDKNVYIANEFAMVEQPKEVNNLVTGGFPFFRGEISLEQKIKLDSTNYQLALNNRYQLIDIYVNGQFVKRSIFDCYVDLSNYLKIGTNEIRLVEVVSNRNLLGPFHSNEEEPKSLGPYTFERAGSWKEDGSSPFYVPRYSFVKQNLK